MNVHAFDMAGLGKAPFKCVGYAKNTLGGVCSYCGTGLLYEYKIVSADGKSFVVGCECVKKTGGEFHVNGFRESRLKLARERRLMKSMQRTVEKHRLFELKRDAARAKFNKDHADVVEQLAWYTMTGDVQTRPFLVASLRVLNTYGHLTDKVIEVLNKIFKQIEDTYNLKDASRFYGDLGKRVKDVNIKCLYSRLIGYNNFGGKSVPRVLNKLVTTNNHQLVWYTDKHIKVSDKFVAASFTVKDHTMFNGIKQTLINRVVFNS